MAETPTTEPAAPPSDQPGAEGPVEPPRTLGATLRRLGPGVIIAGSIVGSGELIATTKVGAEAGFWLLWLVIIGCLIKVFVQVEFGRHTVTHSETPLKALDSVPGPRWRVNWVIWYWAIMTVLIITQQGGIFGGVGQALSMSYPLTEHGQRYNEAEDQRVRAQVELAVAESRGAEEARVGQLRARLQSLQGERVEEPSDPYIWAAILAVITSALLWIGRYGLIQTVALVLVVGFTLTTIATLILLQMRPDWAVSAGELGRGLSFRLPPAVEGEGNPTTTALAAFGIIGVGASELIMYPYWCLEKGYAKFTGRRDGSEGWLQRARGWVRVMQLDAWTSMVVYTFATVAFFLLGAAVLWRSGLNPEKESMIRTLAQMYVPVFGSWAHGVFLVGAVAVLYSTLFVAAAGNSRMVADGLGLFGLHDGTEATRMRWTRWIAAAWPLVAVVLYVFFKSPAAMVLASGLAQAIMLPMLGVAALYFRYRRSEPRLAPGSVWSVLLWISCLGLVIAGGWAAYNTLFG